MLKRSIIAILVFTLLAPLNVGASTWMQQSAMEADDSLMSASMTDMMAHDHDAMMSADHKESMMAAHDHGAEECDDYCMNCSSHCSSTAIVSSDDNVYELELKFAKTSSIDTSSFVYLLYRPPIRA